MTIWRWFCLASRRASNIANECSKQPGVFDLKPFWTFEINLFDNMNFSRRLAITAKKILPMVLVRAIGRNSAGSEVLVDLGIS